MRRSREAVGHHQQPAGTLRQVPGGPYHSSIVALPLKSKLSPPAVSVHVLVHGSLESLRIVLWIAPLTAGAWANTM